MFVLPKYFVRMRTDYTEPNLRKSDCFINQNKKGRKSVKIRVICEKNILKI